MAHPVNGPTAPGCQFPIQSGNEKGDLPEGCLKFRRDREEGSGRLDTESIIYGSNPFLPSVGIRNACGLPVEPSLVLRGLRTMTPIESLLVAVRVCHARSIKLHALHAPGPRVRRNKAAPCSSTLPTSISV